MVRYLIRKLLFITFACHFSVSYSQESSELTTKSNNILQESFIAKDIGDQQSQINSSITYIKRLFAEKRYDEANKLTDNLLVTAQKHGDELLISRILMTKGNGYYQQKHYGDAIVQYTHSLKYLSSEEPKIQKQLGEIYTKIAESYKRAENRIETVDFYKKALDIYTKMQSKKHMARTLNTLAEAERYLGNYFIALNYSNRSLELHEQLKDPLGHAKALMGAGVIYRHIGRYEKSLKHIHEAYLYYKKTNNAVGISKTSNQMGRIYSKLKQFDQAKSFYQFTIDLPEKEIQQQTLASALREMAVIYLNSGDYKLAKIMALKAYKIYQSEKSNSRESLTARIIANIYHAEGNDDKAISYYRNSLSIAIKIGSKIYQIKAQTELAEILIGKNTDESLALLKSSLDISTQINNKSEKLHAHRLLHQLEKSLGHLAKALHYAEKEISLTKLIQNEKDENKLVLAKANLYSHTMEIELNSLREKSKLDELELAKKNNEIEIASQAIVISELGLIKNKYASITLALLLAACLLLVIFIYRRFIDSNKKNKELDYLATRDPLTSCYNRRILFEVMNRDFTDLSLLGEYCIMMVDIDQFKKVNDTYGHCCVIL